MRVLAIDDDAAFIRVLQRMLRDHEVETAENASAAFVELARGRFDVILCDVHMPGMDGRSFVDRLSPMDAARVIFTTGGAFRNGEQAFLATKRVLLKPFTSTQLAEAIEGVIRDVAA